MNNGAVRVLILILSCAVDLFHAEIVNGCRKIDGSFSSLKLSCHGDNSYDQQREYAYYGGYKYVDISCYKEVFSNG